MKTKEYQQPANCIPRSPNHELHIVSAIYSPPRQWWQMTMFVLNHCKLDNSFVILCNLYWHDIIGCYFLSFFQPELLNNWTAYGCISLSRSELFDLPVNIYLIRITISTDLFAICMLKKVIGTFACYQNGILSGSGSLNCDRARAGMYGPLQKVGPHILIAWAHLSWLTKLAAFRSTERNVLNMTEHS